MVRSPGHCFDKLYIFRGVFFTRENELKYLCVLEEHEIDRKISIASDIVKKEPSHKAMVYLYWSIYVPTHTYGRKLWVIIERNK